MAEETTAQFLNRRKRELVAQIAGLRGQLGPKEAELAQITRMEASLTIAGGNALPNDALEALGVANIGGPREGVINPPAGHQSGPGPLPSPIVDWAAGLKNVVTGIEEALRPTAAQIEEIQKAINASLSGTLGPIQTSTAQAHYAAMTIKELVIQALVDHFPNGGTAADIRDFIRDAYGRVVEPSSLRPQMHRLKADGILGHDPSTDTWNFQDGKRRLYVMYDHPTSRRAMKELQDEEPDNNESKFDKAVEATNELFKRPRGDDK